MLADFGRAASLGFSQGQQMGEGSNPLGNFVRMMLADFQEKQKTNDAIATQERLMQGEGRIGAFKDIIKGSYPTTMTYTDPTTGKLTSYTASSGYAPEIISSAYRGLGIPEPTNIQPAANPIPGVSSNPDNAQTNNSLPPGASIITSGGKTTIKPPSAYNRSEKESQFMQKEWDKIVKETNPLTASSRSTLGMAANSNLRADRAIVTLQNPIVTKQEAGNVMADIASIYQSGSPTQFGMSQQEYQTIYGNVQSLRQKITGRPTDALPDAIKSRLLEVLTKLKNVSNGVITNQLDYMEKANAKVIGNFSNEWADIRKTLEGKNTNNATNGFQTTPSGNRYRMIQ